MTCPICKASTSTAGNVHYCGHCGHQFGTIPAAAPLYVPRNVPSLPQAVVTTAPARHSRRWVLIWFLLALVLIVFSGYIGSQLEQHISTTPNDPSVVHYGSGDAQQGIIRHVIITDAYFRADIKPDKSQTPAYYHCNARFTVAGIPESQEEIFWDRDQGIKTNSASIYERCKDYAESNTNDPEHGKPVTLVVSGYRDTANSIFRNILYFIPEDQ